MVLRLFASMRIPLNANVRVYCSLPPPVLISQSNTPTNASAASVCWSSQSKHTMILSRMSFGYSQPLHPTLYTLHLKKSPQKRFFFDFSCIYQKLVVPLHRIQSREAGVIPAQSRCCDSQSDVQILISHWFLANWEG